jgi:hypothetical protein
MRLSELRTSYWKGVIYGSPGVGKSVAAATSQKMRTLVLDVDEGVVAVKAYIARHGLTDKYVTFWPIKEVDDFKHAVAWLERNVRDVDLLVIDTATELQRIIIREICERTKHQTPDQRDWGTALTTLENMTAAFRHMPFHMIYVCHEMSKADQLDSTEKWRPSFQGAFKSEYAKHFSFIGRYVMKMVSAKGADGKETVALRRALHFGPDPYTDAKDRSGALLTWEPPDVDSLFDKLTASGAVGNDHEEGDDSSGDNQG